MVKKKRVDVIKELVDSGVNILKDKDGQHYKLQDITREGGETIQVYTPINLETYKRELREVAHRIASSFYSPVDVLTDIIEDAMEESPLAHVKHIEESLKKEEEKAKEEKREPMVKTKRPAGSCIDIVIGDDSESPRRFRRRDVAILKVR